MIPIEQIEDILSQTQCGECGYEGCTPYAEALLKDETAINRCRPGGELTVTKLAKLLNKPVIRPALAKQPLKSVSIQTDKCIGCTLCIQSCPTNCIIGANKHIHSVYENDCTGCKLCVEICPEDCIDIIPHSVITETSKLNENEKDLWEEKRRDKIHALVKQRNILKHKKLKSAQPTETNKKISISSAQMDIIAKARAKSKVKYSALKLPNNKK
jgi:electron transport complex protein RnfB